MLQKTKQSKVISILLTLCMLCSLIPSMGITAFAGGNYNLVPVNAAADITGDTELTSSTMTAAETQAIVNGKTGLTGDFIVFYSYDSINGYGNYLLYNNGSFLENGETEYTPSAIISAYSSYTIYKLIQGGANPTNRTTVLDLTPYDAEDNDTGIGVDNLQNSTYSNGVYTCASEKWTQELHPVA